jgi:RNA polymerase sigma-70 factor (ECF subfamily)
MADRASRHELPPATAQRLNWFEVLYDTYHRQAFGLAYYLLGNGPEAEDVVQDAYLGVWRSGQMPDPQQASTRSWLLTAVRNRAIDRMRAQRRRADLVKRADRPAPEPDEVPVRVAREIDGQVAHQALERLPGPQREVLELAYFSGLSHTEIATHLALPVGTVKGRLRSALNRLREALAVLQDPPQTA